MTDLNAAQAQVGRASRERTIQWAAISTPDTLKFPGTSIQEVRRALVNVFGNLPIRLSAGEHADMLRAMAVVAGDGAEPYETLLAAVEKFGAVEVTEK